MLEKNVWKINKMSQLYMILARQISKTPEFLRLHIMHFSSDISTRSLDPTRPAGRPNLSPSLGQGWYMA